MMYSQTISQATENTLLGRSTCKDMGKKWSQYIIKYKNQVVKHYIIMDSYY